MIEVGRLCGFAGRRAVRPRHASGVTCDTWHAEGTAGGLGGSGVVLVAARTLSFAHGDDSRHIPASCCGAFGLKQMRERTPIGKG
nr:amidase family protein [Burkholderia anthina]